MMKWRIFDIKSHIVFSSKSFRCFKTIWTGRCIYKHFNRVWSLTFLLFMLNNLSSLPMVYISAWFGSSAPSSFFLSSFSSLEFLFRSQNDFHSEFVWCRTKHRAGKPSKLWSIWPKSVKCLIIKLNWPFLSQRLGEEQFYSLHRWKE